MDNTTASAIAAEYAEDALLHAAHDVEVSPEVRMELIATAQVWATLSMAAAIRESSITPSQWGPK